MGWWLIVTVFTLLVSFVGILVHRTGNHADKHPNSNKIRSAFEKNGSIGVWKEDNNTFHHLIDMEDGTYSDYVIFQDGETSFEKTVFTPKDGKYENVLKYLKSKGKRII